jgi:hypothetical protein
MSLLDTNDFEVTKSYKSMTRTPSARLEFLDSSTETLLGYCVATRGVDLVTLKDSTGMEILHLEKHGLYDSSGDRLADLKGEREGVFKKTRLTWEREGQVLMTFQDSGNKINLMRENNNICATIEVKAKLFQRRHLVVSISQDAAREDRLLTLGMIVWLSAFLM